jgi:hypothetical protein
MTRALCMISPARFSLLDSLQELHETPKTTYNSYTAIAAWVEERSAPLRGALSVITRHDRQIRLLGITLHELAYVRN